jgi:FAD/FMN-containing dehydrogenase
VSETRLSTIAEHLRGGLSGRVVEPLVGDYEALRTVFPGGIDMHPGLIVRPENAADVRHTVNVVRDAGVPLAIRSGGHTIHSTTDGGVVLDMREMTALHIDVQAGTAWAETGLTAAGYSTRVGQYGMATGFGDTGSVGIGGITLGGGIGYLTRKHGLTIDNLRAAEIVTADGKLHRVDRNTEPDLFWAIRGGGGNFGVATRFQYQLQRVEHVVGGMLILPATVDVIERFIAAAEAAPEELTTIANVMTAPPLPFLPPEVHCKLVVLALVCYAGDPVEGEHCLATFRGLAEPLADLLRPMAYHELFPPEDPSYHPTAVGRTMFVDRIDRNDAKTILEFLSASDAPLRVAQLRVLGGAMARVRPEATAFAHRHNKLLVNLAAFYAGESDRPARQQWVNEFAAALHQGNEGAYVNFLNNEGRGRVRAAYPGATWDRLQAIKRQYDPANFFRLNENIAPAG